MCATVLWNGKRPSTLVRATICAPAAQCSCLCSWLWSWAVICSFDQGSSCDCVALLFHVVHTCPLEQHTHAKSDKQQDGCFCQSPTWSPLLCARLTVSSGNFIRLAESLPPPWPSGPMGKMLFFQGAMPVSPSLTYWSKRASVTVSA